MARRPGRPTFESVIADAVADFAKHGFDSIDRLEEWTERIRQAAKETFGVGVGSEEMVREALTRVFVDAVDKQGVLRWSNGVTPFQLRMLRPKLHEELHRRIAASASLITLNKPQAIEKTLQRFQGWATSIPPGGSPAVSRAKDKKEIKKALAQLPYEERRVIIDQSAKLFSAINTTVALDGGAIAAVWLSHKNQIGYNGREMHNDRDGQFFLVPDSWALQAGYIKRGFFPLTTSVEQPAEFPFCKCSWQYKFSLRSLPVECLTQKGADKLAEAKRRIAEMRASAS